MNAIDRFRFMPRAVRWLVWFGAFILGYFVVVEPAMDHAARLDAAADALATSIRRERELATTGAPIAALGAPAVPATAPQAQQALRSRVNALLESQGLAADVNERQSPLRSAEESTKAVIATLTPPAYTLERFTLDLTLEGSPSSITALIADLEQAPEVAAIGRIDLRRAVRSQGDGGGGGGSRRLRAVIAVESWVLVPAARSGGTFAGVTP